MHIISHKMNKYAKCDAAKITLYERTPPPKKIVFLTPYDSSPRFFYFFIFVFQYSSAFQIGNEQKL